MNEHIKFSAAIDTSRIHAMLTKEQAMQAVYSAVKKTAASVEAKTVKRIGQVVNLPAARIRQDISWEAPAYHDPVATMVVRRGKVRMREYLQGWRRVSREDRKDVGVRKGLVKRTNAAARKGGIVLKPRKDEPPERQIRYFAAVMPRSGHFGVFVRGKQEATGKTVQRGKNKGKPQMRGKIHEKFGPTPIGIFAGAKGEDSQVLVDSTSQEGAVILQKNLDSQLDRFLRRSKS